MDRRELWIPIPEDPDQAFADYGGLALSVARWQAPTLQPFEDRIGGMEGMTMNGADVGRWLLTDLGRDDYMKAARQRADRRGSCQRLLVVWVGHQVRHELLPPASARI